ncbi:phage tail protein I [Klebsiella pneumoniae]|uniref:phage tail protein I n=1 Tax=Klebsiella pneumoniae TaxID=573 RepID=UPI001CDA1D0E|nr:phage tail protein I [Klebsiella pneumoniae]
MNSSLLPPSSTAWMRSTGEATARLSAITVALNKVWTPTTCPVDLLPYLAWALSVDRWDKNWPADRKIAAIQQSYWLHRRKGTRAGVRRVIEDMGFSAAFAEWFEVGDVPGTFRLEVDVNETGMTDRSFTELNRLIDDAKPVSRTVSKMNILSRTEGPTSIGAAVCCGDIITVYPDQYQPESGVRYNGQIHFDSNYYFVGDE